MPLSKVLLVEDDLIVRTELAAELEIAGHEVVQAGDAFEAIRLFRAVEPTVVLTDLNMPGGSGFVLLAWLRANDLAVRIFVMSGASTMRKQALDEGAEEFFSKPLDVDTLLRHLSQHARMVE